MRSRFGRSTNDVVPSEPSSCCVRNVTGLFCFRDRLRLRRHLPLRDRWYWCWPRCALNILLPITQRSSCGCATTQPEKASPIISSNSCWGPPHSRIRAKGSCCSCFHCCSRSAIRSPLLHHVHFLFQRTSCARRTVLRRCIEHSDKLFLVQRPLEATHQLVPRRHAHLSGCQTGGIFDSAASVMLWHFRFSEGRRAVPWTDTEALECNLGGLVLATAAVTADAAFSASMMCQRCPCRRSLLDLRIQLGGRLATFEFSKKRSTGLPHRVLCISLCAPFTGVSIALPIMDFRIVAILI